MTKEEIISKIQKGLKDCSEKYNIAPKDIRVKISKEISIGRMGKSETIKSFVMSNNAVIKDTEGKDTQIAIKNLLQLNPMEEMFLNKYLKGAFTKLSLKNKIEEEGINARIFTTSLDFNPSIYLYKGEIAVTPITVEDLTS